MVQVPRGPRACPRRLSARSGDWEGTGALRKLGLKSQTLLRNTCHPGAPHQRWLRPEGALGPPGRTPPTGFQTCVLLTSKELASWGSGAHRTCGTGTVGLTGPCGTDRHRATRCGQRQKHPWLSPGQASPSSYLAGFCPRLCKHRNSNSAPGVIYSRRGASTRSHFITKFPLMRINVKHEEDVNGSGSEVRCSGRRPGQVTGDRRSHVLFSRRNVLG